MLFHQNSFQTKSTDFNFPRENSICKGICENIQQTQNSSMAQWPPWDWMVINDQTSFNLPACPHRTPTFLEGTLFGRFQQLISQWVLWLVKCWKKFHLSLLHKIEFYNIIWWNFLNLAFHKFYFHCQGDPNQVLPFFLSLSGNQIIAKWPPIRIKLILSGQFVKKAVKGL